MNLTALFLILSTLVPGPLKQLQELQKVYFNPRYENPDPKEFNPWNWNLCNLQGGEILGVFGNPGTPNLAFALSFRDLWRTTDEGANWQLSLKTVCHREEYYQRHQGG